MQKNWLIGKDPNAGKDWRQEEKVMTEDEMVGWHHQQDRHEFEQALGVGDQQGSLECCSPWCCKESDTTEQLNWTDSIYEKYHWYFDRDCIESVDCLGNMTIPKILVFTVQWSESVISLFSHSVMSDSLWPHGLQHARLLCPSPSARACSNLCLLSWWWHPTVSSCCPLLLPSIFPSIRVFSSNSSLRIKVLEL